MSRFKLIDRINYNLVKLMRLEFNQKESKTEF